MTKPKCLKLKHEHNRGITIVSIDDAWFEGSIKERYFPVFFVPGSTNTVFNAYDELDGLSVGSFNELLRQKLQSAGFKADETGDLDYLSKLTGLCDEHGINLILANFPYFDANFEDLDDLHVRFLLDISYDDAAINGDDNKDFPPSDFGIYITVKKLVNIPKSQIAFVTGRGYRTHDDQLRKALRAQFNNPAVGRMRGLQVVNKAASEAGMREDVRISLEDWIAAFEQDAAVDSPTARPERLASSLVEVIRKGYGHLDKEKASQVNMDRLLSRFIPFKEDFYGAAGPRCESWKALFLQDPTWRKCQRVLEVDVFQKYMQYLGFNLGVTGLEYIRLPFQPGVVFLIYLAELMRLMGLKSGTISMQSHGDKVLARLTLSGTNHDEMLHLKQRWSAGEYGGTCLAINALLTCEAKSILELAHENPDSHLWTDPNHIELAGPEFILNDNLIAFNWEFNPTPPRPVKYVGDARA